MKVVKIGAGCNGNGELISFGTSRAVLYLLVNMSDVPNAATAIHSTFFSASRCVL
ncbi:MAG: hypothetical protein JRE21_04685 [Deltaproteobacteria bacterium]|jgi:hypothetical protein|nr:hypothetical protein [Deltaproteobacteria bacterium]